MVLGKIRVRVEHLNPKWIYCRPVSDGHSRVFPSRIGTAHVVHVERSELTSDIVRGGEYDYFAIFSREVSEEDFARGFIDVKISPISIEAYNSLILIYNQNQHSFEF